MSPLIALTLLAAPPQPEIATAPFRDLAMVKRFYPLAMEYARVNDGMGLSNLLADHVTGDYQLFQPGQKAMDLNSLQGYLMKRAQVNDLSSITMYDVVKIEGDGNPRWIFTVREEGTASPKPNARPARYVQMSRDTWLRTASGYQLKKTDCGPVLTPRPSAKPTATKPTATKPTARRRG